MRNRVPSAGTDAPVLRTVYDAPVQHEVDQTYAAMLGQTDTTPDRTLPFAVEIYRQVMFEEADPLRHWDERLGRLEYCGPEMCLELKLSQRVKAKGRDAEHEKVTLFSFESLEQAQFLGEFILALVDKMRRTADAHRIPLLYDDEPPAARTPEQQVC